MRLLTLIAILRFILLFWRHRSGLSHAYTLIKWVISLENCMRFYDFPAMQESSLNSLLQCSARICVCRQDLIVFISVYWVKLAIMKRFSSFGLKVPSIGSHGLLIQVRKASITQYCNRYPVSKVDLPMFIFGSEIY